MPHARHACARRHQTTRLVRVSRLARRAQFPYTSHALFHLSGVAIGAYGAELMRRLFPAFYTAHVAQRRMTPQSLLGVTQAFVSLARQHLVELDEMFQEFIIGDPLRVLEMDGIHDDADALQILITQARNYLYCPPLTVYGLELEALHDHDDHLLAIGLWLVLSATAWGMNNDVEGELHMLVPTDHADQLWALPRLRSDVDVDALCAALEHHPEAQELRLAELLRYVSQQTQNPFADYTMDEVGESYYRGYSPLGITWSADMLHVRTLQQQAAALYHHYLDLTRALTDAPDLTRLREMAQRICDTADVLPPLSRARQEQLAWTRIAQEVTVGELLDAQEVALHQTLGVYPVHEVDHADHF